MKHRQKTRSVSIVISSVYFATNCAFAHLPTKTIWDERRPSLDFKQQPRQLHLPTGVPLRPFHELSAFGSVRKALKPTGASKGTVLHILDVHQNSEAQSNIGLAVESLIGSRRAGLIALEGAFAPMNFTSFQRFQERRTLRSVADYLLQHNKISGPVHALMTLSPNPSVNDPTIIGIDDETHYSRNVQAYIASSSFIAAKKKRLADEEIALERDKSTAFHPALRSFDQKAMSYRHGTTSLGAFVMALASEQATLPPAVSNFAEAYRLEQKINFERVESERGTVISRLLSRMNAGQTDGLTSLVAAFRAGTMSNADFYGAFKTTCKETGVSLNTYPDLSHYLRYVELANAIDSEQLYTEIRHVEDATYERLARTAREKELIQKSKNLFLASKLADFALTRDEWKQYVARADLKSFEDFYNEAVIRDERMAENVLNALQHDSTSDKRAMSVLVTGGFHSDGIDRRLADAGYTVLQFTPKITKIDTANGSAYLGLFAQDKTPLAKLFEGEKLFLSPLQTENIPLAAAAVAGIDGAEAFHDLLPVSHANAHVERVHRSDGLLESRIHIDVKGKATANVTTLWRATNNTAMVVTINEKPIKPTQSWNGSDGLEMPLLEEALRFGAMAAFGPAGAAVYIVTHAFLHFYIDIYSKRGEQLNWAEFLFHRFPIRMLYSLAFTLPVFAYGPLNSSGFDLALAAHAINNRWGILPMSLTGTRSESNGIDLLGLYLKAIGQYPLLKPSEERIVANRVEETRWRWLTEMISTPAAMAHVIKELEENAKGEFAPTFIYPQRQKGESRKLTPKELQRVKQFASELSGLYPSEFLLTIRRLDAENTTVSFNIVRVVKSLFEQIDAFGYSEEQKRAIKIARQNFLNARNALANHNLRLVVSRAKLFFPYAEELQISMADLIGEGNDALISAVDGFRANKGNKFSTYATWAVNRRLSDLLRYHHRHPLGHSLSNSSTESEETIYENLMADKRASHVENIESTDREMAIKRNVHEWLRTVDKREGAIIALRKGIDTDHEWTLEEIARDFRITKERVRQIEQRGMRRLRQVVLTNLEMTDPDALTTIATTQRVMMDPNFIRIFFEEGVRAARTYLRVEVAPWDFREIIGLLFDPFFVSRRHDNSLRDKTTGEIINDFDQQKYDARVRARIHSAWPFWMVSALLLASIPIVAGFDFAMPVFALEILALVATVYRSVLKHRQHNINDPNAALTTTRTQKKTPLFTIQKHYILEMRRYPPLEEAVQIGMFRELDRRNYQLFTALVTNPNARKLVVKRLERDIFAGNGAPPLSLSIQKSKETQTYLQADERPKLERFAARLAGQHPLDVPQQIAVWNKQNPRVQINIGKIIRNLIADRHQLGYTNREQIAIESMLQFRDKVQNAISRRNLRLVTNVAKTYRGRLGATDLETLDLISAGNKGLLWAIAGFRLERGFKFSTYATWLIRRAMFQEVKRRRHIHIETQLDARSSNGGKTTSSDQIADPRSTLALKEFENQKLLERLIDAANLSARSTRVMLLYFGLDGNDELNLREIGNLYGLTKARIQQITQGSLTRLRNAADQLRVALTMPSTVQRHRNNPRVQELVRFGRPDLALRYIQRELAPWDRWEILFSLVDPFFISRRHDNGRYDAATGKLIREFDEETYAAGMRARLWISFPTWIVSGAFIISSTLVISGAMAIGYLAMFFPAFAASLYWHISQHEKQNKDDTAATLTMGGRNLNELIGPAAKLDIGETISTRPLPNKKLHIFARAGDEARLAALLAENIQAEADITVDASAFELFKPLISNRVRVESIKDLYLGDALNRDVFDSQIANLKARKELGNALVVIPEEMIHRLATDEKTALVAFSGITCVTLEDFLSGLPEIPAWHLDAIVGALRLAGVAA